MTLNIPQDIYTRLRFPVVFRGQFTVKFTDKQVIRSIQPTNARVRIFKYMVR